MRGCSKAKQWVERTEGEGYFLLHGLNEKPGSGEVNGLRRVIALGSSGIAFLDIERLFLPQDRNAISTKERSVTAGWLG